MKEQLGWTTLEQSKKLVEAGLDPNTADMFYTSLNMHKTPWVWNSKPFLHPADVPCWSLGRLIELMPESVNWRKLVITKPYIAYVNLEEWVYSGHSYFEACDDTLIENAVATICWLLENNYIKKREMK